MQKRLILGALMLCPIIGVADTLPQNHKEGIVEFCSTCHGVNGVSTLDHIPNLWGQSDQYLREQVENFRSKKRHTTFMDAFIYQITDEQMDTIIKHYSSVPDAMTFKLQWRGDKWPGDMQLGEKIAYSGKMEANVPSCVACHGPSGVGVKPGIPRLAGQNSAYLVNQMKSWKEDTRPAGAMAIMGPIAKSLSDEEIKAVSDYFASLGTPVAQKTAEVKKMKYLLLSLSLLSGMAFANDGHKDLGSVEPGKPLTQGEAYHQVPDWGNVPEEHFAEAVKRGYSIFMNSQQLKQSGAVGNGLNCTNCHLSGGRLANSAPMWAAYVSYPAYRGKNKKVNTYEDRLQGCFAYSMNGKPPEAVSQTILDLTAYSYWLATDAKVNAKIAGRGFPKLEQPELKPEFVRGEVVYAAQCALCHGDNGEGRKVDNRYVFPPLWGKDSYNWGAGMHKISGAANFIKANMPLSKGYSLTDQQAWDVAMFINGHERPQDPRFSKSVSETAKEFHAKDSLYGTPSALDKHILGSKAY